MTLSLIYENEGVTKETKQRDNTNDDPEDKELKSHYMYMAKIKRYSDSAADWDSVLQLQRIWTCNKGMRESKAGMRFSLSQGKDVAVYLGSAVDWDSVLKLQRIEACSKGMQENKASRIRSTHVHGKDQEVIPDPADNSRPIFDTEILEKIHNTNDNYNVFDNERQHPEKPKSINDKYKPIGVPISTREPKRTMNQSIAKPHRKTVASESTIQKPKSTSRRLYEHLVEIILFIVDSGCTKHMTGNLKENGCSFVCEASGERCKMVGNRERVAVGIGGKHCALHSVSKSGTAGKSLNADTSNVNFVCGTCGARGINLYSITPQETTSPNPIFLMAKASSSQAWLWHRRLSHLNFDTINLLSKNDIVNGLLSKIIFVLLEKYTICLGEVYHLLRRRIPFAWEKYTICLEFMIIAGVDNRPPMLEKSCMTHGRVDNTTRTKKYEELLVAKKLQADCDLKATNIILQGLPPDVYAIVNHHKILKEIWDIVKLFMQGTKLSLQEKECLAVHVFSQRDDPIAYLYKAMAFLIAVVSSSCKGNAISFGGNNAGGQARMVKCYNCQEAHESGQISDEEQLAFLADLGILDDQATQTTILNTDAFQTEDLDTYDYNCEDLSNTKAMLMANLSNYRSDIIS
nr:integrase, catalytic region, zinc finger, CCHC-type, peptidase aspartic, catalytic [Tanacetum cinerariifolium]